MRRHDPARFCLMGAATLCAVLWTHAAGARAEPQLDLIFASDLAGQFHAQECGGAGPRAGGGAAPRAGGGAPVAAVAGVPGVLAGALLDERVVTRAVFAVGGTMFMVGATAYALIHPQGQGG